MTEKKMADSSIVPSHSLGTPCGQKAEVVSHLEQRRDELKRLIFIYRGQPDFADYVSELRWELGDVERDILYYKVESGTITREEMRKFVSVE